MGAGKNRAEAGVDSSVALGGRRGDWQDVLAAGSRDSSLSDGFIFTSRQETLLLEY